MNRILIAEDDDSISNLLKTALNGAGYTCCCAADGKTAADLLEKEPFDLALLDIMLPEIDGYELMEYCRQGCGERPGEGPSHGRRGLHLQAF